MNESGLFSESELLNILALSKDATAIYTTEELIIHMANDAMIGFWGKDRNVIGKSFIDAVPELVGQPFFDLLKKVWRTGETYEATNMAAQLRRGDQLQWFYYDFIYRAVKNKNGEVYCILHTATDVTERQYKIEAGQQREQNLNEELSATNEELQSANEEIAATNDELVDSRLKLIELNAELEQRVIARTDQLNDAFELLKINEQKLLNMVRQAPVGMCIVSGEPLRLVEANDLFLEIIGKRREQFENTPYWEVNAQAASYYEPIIERVKANGVAYRANEQEIMLVRNGKEETTYVDFVYEPILGAGNMVESIMIVVIDVSDKVAARKAIEDSSEELAASNEELAAANEELASINEEMASINEELTVTNEELGNTQENLQRSEKLFKSIALNIPKSLIIVIDQEHRYVTIEGDIMQKMGYDGKEYAGKHPSEISPAERYEINKPLFDRVMLGEHFSIERKTDAGEYYKVHFVPLKNDAGEVERGLIIALDITDIKEAEEKSAKLAAIIATSDDAIVSKTLESVITSWNDSAERIFGYTAEEMIGETIYKLIPEDRKGEEPEILARLKSGERVDHFETKRLKKDGTLIDVSVTVSPLIDSQGNIIGLSKIARDITEKKIDEIRKNDFIGMVSHELKTPLTSLYAIIQVANSKLRDSGDLFLAGAMAKANIQVKRMSSMINGFLNISRLEAGKIMIEKQPFKLDELLQEIVEEARLIASTQTVKLEICGPVEINADRDKISSVVSNLVSNAVKYSPKGKLIEIACRVSGDMVIVSVKDDGMGIEAQDLDHIFDRYYRVETDSTRNISGFGIGLYLSSEIIKRHNGKIWVESEDDKGSTFYFSLPL
jgi:PAS domain S-box-containing protein